MRTNRWIAESKFWIVYHADKGVRLGTITLKDGAYVASVENERGRTNEIGTYRRREAAGNALFESWMNAE